MVWRTLDHLRPRLVSGKHPLLPHPATRGQCGAEAGDRQQHQIYRAHPVGLAVTGRCDHQQATNCTIGTPRLPPPALSASAALRSMSSPWSACRHGTSRDVPEPQHHTVGLVGVVGPNHRAYFGGDTGYTKSFTVGIGRGPIGAVADQRTPQQRLGGRVDQTQHLLLDIGRLGAGIRARRPGQCLSQARRSRAQRVATIRPRGDRKRGAAARSGSPPSDPVAIASAAQPRAAGRHHPP